MTAIAFGFTKLVVADLDGEERFYREVFGMETVSRVAAADHEFALDECIMRLPGSSAGHALIITRYRTRACPPVGAVWTGFTVPELGKALSDVVAAGGRIEVPAHENADHGVLAAIAEDPEGHLIEIIQMLKG